MRALLVVTALVLVPAAPAGAATWTAPGRVVSELDPGTIRSVDASAPAVGAARADGGVVLAGPDRGRGLRVLALRADGSRDRAFGADGQARIAVPDVRGPVGALPGQVLLRPDGGVLVTFDGPGDPRRPLPLAVVALTADGAIDRAFGQDGLAVTAVGGGQAALAPDGALIAAGTPTADGMRGSAVTRLDAAGRPDAAFGTVALPGPSNLIRGIAVGADARITILGSDGRDRALVRLEPTGAPDPTFGSGAPVLLGPGPTSGASLVVRADGRSVVTAAQAGEARLEQRTADGRLDEAWGDRGVVVVPTGLSQAATLLAADGELVVTGASAPRARPGRPFTQRVTRVTPDGTPGVTLEGQLAAGGGIATTPSRTRDPRPTSLEQNGFGPGRPLLRPDGSLVVPGGLRVARDDGDGTGIERELSAVFAFGRDATPAPGFGARRTPVTLAVRVPVQRARVGAQRSLLRLAVDATTSAPGLARIEVRAGRTLLAASTAPVFRAGRQRLAAFLTAAGRTRLRRARELRVRVRVTFRDVLGGGSVAAGATGRLR